MLPHLCLSLLLSELFHGQSPQLPDSGYRDNRRGYGDRECYEEPSDHWGCEYHNV